MNRNEFFDSLPLTRIVLRLTSATMDICTDDIDEIGVVVSGADGDVKALRVAVSGNQLLVEQPALSLQKNPIETSWLQVTICIPLDWKGRIEGRTVSGWINARGLSGSDLTLDTVSGLINANAVFFGDITLRSVTGDIRVTDLTCTRGSFITTSGAISVQQASIDQCSLLSITGGMTLGFRSPFGSITANSVVGDLSIDAPVSQCAATHRSVAGRISSDNVSIIGEAGPSVLFSSVSGNLDISRTDPVQ
ncbi:MAG: DUF4097 family beta strand repeat protein [Clostridia bacterium]|nr:DUF4097 family beta strand repeat protein [Clostridia bacterium]